MSKVSYITYKHQISKSIISI